MTLKFSAEITVDAGESTASIFDSISADNRFYPENPAKTRILYNDGIQILMISDQIQHLRANINSMLRLVQASHDAITTTSVHQV